MRAPLSCCTIVTYTPCDCFDITLLSAPHFFWKFLPYSEWTMWQIWSSSHQLFVIIWSMIISAHNATDQYFSIFRKDLWLCIKWTGKARRINTSLLSEYNITWKKKKKKLIFYLLNFKLYMNIWDQSLVYFGDSGYLYRPKIAEIFVWNEHFLGAYADQFEVSYHIVLIRQNFIQYLLYYFIGV